MTLEYEAMQRGERPIHADCLSTVELELSEKGEIPVYVESKNKQKVVSCLSKEFGTSRRQRITNRSHPFILPGLGESGEHCGKSVVYGIGINGDKIGTMSLKCKRIECKDCYSTWVMNQVFERTFKIEAYAKVTGDRPSHVAASISPEVCRTWKELSDYDTFHKRVYRHIASMGGNAGLRIFHPYRIKYDVKKELKKAGYGTQGNGYWKGVRENALNYEQFEQYYSLAVHDHIIVFPSFLTEHTDRKFMVKKIRVVETIEDTIKLLYYLISHCGVLKDTEESDNHPLAFFGELHRFNPEKFLSPEEILQLKTEIAEKMHCKFVDGELIPVSDDEKPSNKDQFYPITDFVLATNKDGFYKKGKDGSKKFVEYYDSRSNDWIYDIINSFPEKYRVFWWGVIDEYNRKITDPDLRKEDKYLFLEDIDLPDGIEAVEVI